MKTKLFPLLAALLLVASCGGGYNPPEPDPDKGNNDDDGRVEAGYATANFSYETSHPFYVVFNNTSKKATSYKWDFGDGTTSTEKNPVHKYSGKGVYKVSLTAGGKGHDTMSKNITITEPTSCYVTSIEFNKIPKNNEYYSVRYTDDYIFFETLYWYTDWCLLSDANMPYTYNLKTKKKIDFSNSKYVMRLYKNSKSSGSGTQVQAWSMQTKNIQSKFSEEITGTTNDAEIKLILKWED